MLRKCKKKPTPVQTRIDSSHNSLHCSCVQAMMGTVFCVSKDALIKYSSVERVKKITILVNGLYKKYFCQVLLWLCGLERCSQELCSYPKLLVKTFVFYVFADWKIAIEN